MQQNPLPGEAITPPWLQMPGQTTDGLRAWAFFGFLLLTFACRHGLAELFERWGTDPAYSHGFVMPFLIGFLIYRDRTRIRLEAQGGSWMGILLLAVGLAAFTVAEIGRIYAVVHYAYLIALCGLAWAALGDRSPRVLLPLSLFAFAIPLPAFTQAILTTDLQLLSSRLGTALIRLFQIPVTLEGNIIDLGAFQLHVAEACAGLNYLFPLLGIAHLCAYLFRTALWKRVFLVLSAVPLTIVMNVIRIASVGGLVNRFGPGAAEGFVHFFQGWVIFLVSTCVILGEMAVLNRLGSKRVLLTNLLAAPGSRRELAPERIRWDAPIQLRTATIMIAIALIGTYALERLPTQEPDRTEFALFPMFIDDWDGVRRRLDPRIEDELAADDYMLASYRHGVQEPAVELFIAYYSAQQRGRRPHSPAVCLPGGGWEIDVLSRAADPIPGRSGYPMNRVLMRKGEQRLLAYYWFTQRGKQYANEYAMKWDLFAGAISSGRRDGAMFRVMTPIDDDEAIEDAEARLGALLLATITVLPRYVPST
jgi:exosortase D (VPLPA-CTERM-specific)